MRTTPRFVVMRDSDPCHSRPELKSSRNPAESASTNVYHLGRAVHGDAGRLARSVVLGACVEGTAPPKVPVATKIEGIILDPVGEETGRPPLKETDRRAYARMTLGGFIAQRKGGKLALGPLRSNRTQRLLFTLAESEAQKGGKFVRLFFNKDGLVGRVRFRAGEGVLDAPGKHLVERPRIDFDWKPAGDVENDKPSDEFEVVDDDAPLAELAVELVLELTDEMGSPVAPRPLTSDEAGAIDRGGIVFEDRGTARYAEAVATAVLRRSGRWCRLQSGIVGVYGSQGLRILG
jgi:hypothetical protein